MTGIPFKHTEITHSFFSNYRYFFNATCSTCSFNSFNRAGCRSGLMEGQDYKQCLTAYSNYIYLYVLDTEYLQISLFLPKLL